MLFRSLGHYDRETEIAITAAKSGLDKASASRIVDVVRGFRESHQADQGSQGICPTVRASIMIATVLNSYGAKPTLSDENFVHLCQDVLDSSRWDSTPSRTIKTKVTGLIRKFAA